MHKRIYKEVIILKKTQYGEVSKDTAGQKQFPSEYMLRRGEQQRNGIINRAGKKQQGEETVVPAGIKIIGGCQQYTVLYPVRSPYIEGQHYQKENKELKAIGKHA
jgi:hypothetical protein